MKLNLTLSSLLSFFFSYSHSSLSFSLTHIQIFFFNQFKVFWVFYRLSKHFSKTLLHIVIEQPFFHEQTNIFCFKRKTKKCYFRTKQKDYIILFCPNFIISTLDVIDACYNFTFVSKRYLSNEQSFALKNYTKW